MSTITNFAEQEYYLNERTTYEDLINVKALKLNIPAFKHRRSRQLEALAALVATDAITRVHELFGPEIAAQIQLFESYIQSKSKEQRKTNYIHYAYPYAIEDFIRQIKRDNERLGGAAGIAHLTKKGKEDLASLELEELNERYTPIIEAIKILNPRSRFPEKLSLDSMTRFNSKPAQ